MAHKVKSPHRRSNRRTLASELADKGMTAEQAEQKCIDCLNLATRMTDHAKARINEIYSLNKKEWVFCWNLDNMLVDYFGKVNRKMHVRKVYNRMLSASYRLSKGIVIRLRPQEERTGTAQSAGWFAEPKRFKVFTSLLDRTDEEIASVFVHELIHLWFRDQKISGDKVSNQQEMLDLAENFPRKARRSPENYERFVLDLWGQTVYVE